MNLSNSKETPFYKRRLFLIISGLVFLGLVGKMCSPSNINNQNQQTVKQGRLKEVVTYTESPYTKKGYETIKTYYYGLYLPMPKDTTGVAGEIMGFLKNKAAIAKSNEVVHLWIFTDSTVIPKTFSGDWSTEKSRKKCFGHAAKLANGNYLYNYDMFGEFKPE